MNNFNYRILNPRNDLDIKKYFELVNALNDFCDTPKEIDEETINWTRFHLGAIEYINKALNQKQLPPLEENSSEYVFICEHKEKFVGYVKICAYHLINGKRPNDDIGILHEIFVLNEFRNGAIAYKLLQLAVDKLMERGKKHALCNVQEHNPNRFLHFAMADNNIIQKQKFKRANGEISTDYTLLIDLAKLKNMSLLQLAKKAVFIKRKQMSK